MDMAYEDVLERLREERFIHRLSQEDLSRRLKITQGHYSKAEHAIKIKRRSRESKKKSDEYRVNKISVDISL